MHITLEADYAIRIIYTLAHKKGLTNARTISEETFVTLRFTLKILRKLVIAGLVNSKKGSHAGYILAKSPEDISIYDIIYAVCGEYNLSRCLADDYNCIRKESVGCKIQPVFDRVSKMVRTELSQVKIADLMEKSRADEKTDN